MRALRRLPRTWAQKVHDAVEVGVLDVYAGVNGLSISLELKTSTRLSRKQLSNINKANATGSLAFAVDPLNWPTVFKFLYALAYAPNWAFKWRALEATPERVPERLMPKKRKAPKRKRPGAESKDWSLEAN